MNFAGIVGPIDGGYLDNILTDMFNLYGELFNESVAQWYFFTKLIERIIVISVKLEYC